MNPIPGSNPTLAGRDCRLRIILMFGGLGSPNIARESPTTAVHKNAQSGGESAFSARYAAVL
jgi:hypothetical protein